MTMLRPLAFFASFLTCVAVSPAVAQGADAYPARAVKVLVPFPPGGVVDVMARILTQKMSEKLGQNFYVDNQGGAGGNIGTSVAAQAQPDGYTILMSSSSFVVNPSLHAKVAYDPVKSFTPITIAAASPNALVVHPSVKAQTVEDLVALIKATPGGGSFASAGVGTTPHLAGELFRLSFGIEMTHIPFTGAGPALSSVVGGHTPVAFLALPASVPFIQNGSVRAIAVTGAERSAATPSVPTLAEAGFPGQVSETLIFIMAPAGTPPDIVRKLNRTIVDVVASPDVKERFDTLGFSPLRMTPAEAGARLKDELATWSRVIREAKLAQP